MNRSFARSVSLALVAVGSLTLAACKPKEPDPVPVQVTAPAPEPMPAPDERYRLWTEALPKQLAPDAELDFISLAERYEVSGGTIINVIRYAALRSLVRGDGRLASEDVHHGIRRELLKEGQGF